MKLSKTTLMELTREYRKILKKSFLLGSFGVFLIASQNALAEFYVHQASYSSGNALYGATASTADYKLAETNNTNTFTKKQTFNSFAFGSGQTVSSIATSVTSGSTNSQLVTAKAVYDAISASTGITSSDLETALSDYVKSDDLSTTLGGYVASSDLTTTLAGYATTGSVYSKTDADGKFATKTEISGLLSADTAASTYATQTALNSLSGTVAGKADASDLTALAGRVTQTETDIGTINSSAAMTSGITADKVSAYDGYASQIAAKADASALATKANSSDLTALAGRVTQTETDIGTINSSAAMTSGITADKVSTYDGYASQIAAKQDALTSDQMALLNSGITAADVSNMAGMGTRLTAIEDDYLTSSDKTELVSAIGTAKTEANSYTDTKISDEVTARNSAITTAINNEVTARNTAISNAANQIRTDFAAADAATLTSAKSYADSKTTLTAAGSNYSEGSILTAIASLDNAIDTNSSLLGDIANLEATHAGNLAAKGSPVAAHLAALDARLGHIDGLASTLTNSQGKMNLSQHSDASDHFVVLAGAIGDRTNYSEQNVISNNQTVAQSLDSLDVAVGDIQRNMTASQAANNARFERIESKITQLDDKINKGLAANNALAGLVPLDHCHRTQISAAMGGYSDNQALAVGAFHYINDRTLLNAGAAYGGNSSISYKVGVTFGF